MNWTPASGGYFVPFDDGSSIQLWDDDERCESEVRRLSAVDVDGWRDFCSVKARLRDALRPAGEGDIWVGKAPTLDEIEEKLGGDTEARKIAIADEADLGSGTIVDVRRPSTPAPPTER